MKQLRVTVDGKTYEVTVEVVAEDGNGRRKSERPPAGAGSASVEQPVVAPSRPPPAATTPDGAVVSPMSGSIVKVFVKNGDKVSSGQEVIMLEAMKMETPITAPTDGVVAGLSVTPGSTVEEGQPLFKLES